MNDAASDEILIMITTVALVFDEVETHSWPDNVQLVACKSIDVRRMLAALDC